MPLMVLKLFSLLWLFTLLTEYVSAGKNDVKSYFTYDLRMPEVHLVKADQYIFRAYKLPENETSSIIHFEPLVNMSIAHHLSVFGCEKIKIKKYNETECEKSKKTFYVWALNAPPLDLPEGVGFHVGYGTTVKYLILNIHYINGSPNGTKTDSSGVRLYFTQEPQPKYARVTKAVGCGYLKPNSTAVREMDCKIRINITAYPFAFRPHTHGLGTYVSGYIVKKNDFGVMEWRLIGAKNPQLPQFFYPVENGKNLIIGKGDIFTARCDYNNTRPNVVKFGFKHSDEMCVFYLMYYVYDDEMPHIEPCSNSNCYHRWTDSQLTNIPTIPNMQ